MTNQKHRQDKESSVGAPVFIQLTPDLHGSVAAGPGGSFLVSFFHEPTGRTGFGIEDTYDGAISWLQGARLIFQDSGGVA